MNSRGSKILPWALGTAVAVAILVSILLLGTALRTQQRAGNAIHNHLENSLILQRALGLLVDAETGQRGFLLTSNISFLRPYERARAQLPTALKLLTEDGVIASDGRFQYFAKYKMRELALTLQLTHDGRKAEALHIVQTGPGKPLMDAIRTETGRLIAIERGRVDAEIKTSETYIARIYLALLLLVVSVAALLWLGLTNVLRNQRLEAEATRLREVERAQSRTALVAKELNHRVKNLFSIVLAIIQLASRGATNPKDAVDRIRERVQALARAHEVSLGADPLNAFDFETMLKTLLAPYASNAEELELNGPSIQLPVMRVTPLGLIIHELATNSVKYGAWSTEAGCVDVQWSVDDVQAMNGALGAKMLRLRWEERSTHPLQVEGKKGFGSQLINSAVAQLNGSITRERGDYGLTIVIDAPIVPTTQFDGQS